MKIRVGYGLGTRSQSNDGARFEALVDALEELRFDSLWLSERIGGESPDPLIGMAYACGRTTRLKVGMSVLVVPGRNPVVLAKSIASLDRLSGGRVLPAFGLGIADSGEHQAFGVKRRERGAWFNEAVPLMRRLWEEDSVTHEGKRFQIKSVTVRPKPVQERLEVWLGGIAPLELRRVGRHGDGWLPSFCTVDQVAAARVVIEREAAEAGRSIDDDHWGALIPYRADGTEVPDALATLARVRNPDADPADIVPTISELPATLERFAAANFTKFVLIPAAEPEHWSDELQLIADQVKPLEN